ncbi:isochorismatase [Bombardia bombarda]|uniref:nicotinamidase n=1 Tax=Bombardia bombarda TaxID=252184 RepID=A0AA39XAR7_9PEZI|nr:isochorismatase [Bombardia bombarda]
MAEQPSEAMKAALLVVDMQEDFCPPNGSLAVASARDTIPLINSLLALPSFAIRIATKDWHPASHISFACNHAGKQPFVDTCTVVNPNDPADSYETRLWPVHCVQDTPGAALVTELDATRFDRVIEKGIDPRVEMYSAFYDPFTPHVSDSGLAAILKDAAITHVYVVGLAGDYCVRHTAVDAATEGFTTFIIEEATRPVDGPGWPQCKGEIEATGVRVVTQDSPEVRRLYA